jgi:hypothetical protein
MKDKAAGAIKHRTTVLPPLEFSAAPTIASDQRMIFREIVIEAGSISAGSDSSSRERSPSRQQSNHGSPKDFGPIRGVLF